MSPTAMHTGDCPTLIGELGPSVKLILELESTNPSKMETLLVDWFTTARSTSGLLLDLLVVARKFAVTMAIGPFSEIVEVLVSANGEPGNSVNPPLPSPLKMEIVLSSLLATAKSVFPSPLKSATRTELGFFPTA